jgi:glycosyltransferase involved in cell wall biosynthesis
MRFIVCIGWAQPPMGNQFTKLCEELSDEGHDVVLVCSGGVEETGLRAPPYGGTLSVLHWPSVRPVKLADGRLVWDLLRRFEPDCVVAQQSSVNWAISLGFITRVPVRVAWVQTHLSESPDFREVRRNLATRLRMLRRSAIYRLATRLVSVAGEAGLDELESWYHVRRNRCVVIPNSLGQPDPFRGPRESTGRRVVSLGRLVTLKGHATLLDAFARMSRTTRETSELLIAGDGPLRSALEEQSRRLGIEANVQFTGRVTHKEAMAILETAGVFVHPSWSDASPFSVIEAMSMGVPIIATAVGGVQEMIRAGADGLLVPPRDPAALAIALEHLLEDALERLKFAEASRRRFVERFQVEHWVRSVKSLLSTELEHAGRLRGADDH